MNFKKLFPIVIVLSLFFAGSADAKSFPVIKDGKAVVELVPDKNPACIEAAKLVEKYLSKSTGSSMKVPAGSPQILFKIEKGKLDIEGFRFSFPTAGKMVITGGGPNGVKYGALEFVEQFMGVRFLYPGPAGEHVYKVEKCKQPTIPLKFYADSSAFKLYMLDCGLLACLSEANPNTMLLNDNAFVEFKGAFTENFVLQHLKATNNISIFYYSKDNSTMEIDFLLQTEEKVIPIEVKASVNVKSKSLSLFVNEDFKDKNFKAVRFSLKPYIDQEWMENITLYAVDSYIRSILV